MRVLQVVTDDDRRGAQVFAVELGARLAGLGAEVRTVALEPGEIGGLEVEALGRAPWRRNLRALRAAARETDVVIGHGSTTLPACVIAGLGIGRPFVYRQISDPVYWTPTRAKRLRTAALYRRTAGVVALSPVTATVLEERFRIPAAKITVIPNAVDERRWTQASPAQREAARTDLHLPARAVVAYVGSLAEEKGVVDLVRALDEGWHLLVVGDGPERAALEQQVKERGLDATFAGSVADPWSAYAAADVLVLPSRSDMQPAVLIEAALCGTPCVATDVGAVRELVLDGKTGRVVPPGDAGALRDGITEVLEDADGRAAMAAAAAAHALQHHSMDAIAPRWLELLEALARR